MSFKERGRCLLRAREYLLDNLNDFALTITRDNGKPVTESISAEILPVCDLLWWTAHNAKNLLQPRRLPLGVFDLLLRSSSISHQPLGVIGIISPWNYPFSIPAGAVATALMAGNTVLLKPSSATPLVGKKIEDMFNAAGLPEATFFHLVGGTEVGEALLDSRLDKVVFTGSVDVGRHVAEVCARKLVPVTLELGGKDPAIVRADADLDAASSGIVWGAFTNAGQCCASIERCYVHSSIADEFITMVVEKTKKLRVGNGEAPDTDVGPMTTLQQLQTVEAHVEDARRRGAKILCGGKRAAVIPLMGDGIGPDKSGNYSGYLIRPDKSGNHYEPTVITGVDHSFACVTEETFGPTLPIMTFDDDEQAIRLANDSPFGLNAYIWTKDMRRAKKMAAQIRAGTVVIDDSVYTHAIPATPWGGLKHSGWGRTHGAWGFYELTNLHHVHINRLSWLKDFWWYPYGEPLMRTLKKLSLTLTGGFFDKIKALFGIIRALLYKKI
jgi:succinate-semialdehyde dehydrogenase/glutarate-semialdehyde dehydrogenase